MFSTKLADPYKATFFYLSRFDIHPLYLIIRFCIFYVVLGWSYFSCFVMNNSLALLASVNFLFHGFFLASQLIIKFNLELVYIDHLFYFFNFRIAFLEWLSSAFSCCLCGNLSARTFSSSRTTCCLFCSGHR
jgi:hypothetical protein